MKPRRQSWLHRLCAFIHRPDAHHRICWRCHKPIKRHEHWHQIKVGWFAPAYTVVHANCKNTTEEAPQEIAQRLEPELPFDQHSLGDMPPYGDVYPTYGGIEQSESLPQPKEDL